jgi:hypothetical protein
LVLFLFKQIKPNSLYAQEKKLAKNNNPAYFRECVIKKLFEKSQKNDLLAAAEGLNCISVK